MCLFVYDLKYDDLTRLTYNTYLSLNHQVKNPPHFYSLNFDDYATTYRCNPIDPATLDDLSDAAEVSRTFLLALNKTLDPLPG